MRKRTDGGTPKVYPFRVLNLRLKATVVKLSGPPEEKVLAKGTRIEIIEIRGKRAAIGLLGEGQARRVGGQIKELTMLSVNSFQLLEFSSAL